MASEKRRHSSSLSRDRLRHAFIWTLLAATTLTITIVRGRDPYWPMIAWVMYSTIDPPPSVVRAIRIDATSVSGSRRSFFPTDFLTHVERPLVESVMWQAFDSTASRSASRRFLSTLLMRKWPEVILDSVSGSRVEWDVSPNHFRDFSRDEPDREIFLGRFKPGREP